MKKILIAGILVFAIFQTFGQTISDEARKHFVRGLTIVEMAKSPADFETSVTEFETAIRLAPNWVEAYFNLGAIQENLGRYEQAIVNFKRYLQMFPNAKDSGAVKDLITKTEYKLELKKKEFEQYRKITGVWSSSYGAWFDEYAFYTEGNDLKMKIFHTTPKDSSVSFDGQILRAKWRGNKTLYFDPAEFELNAKLNADSSMTGILKEATIGGSTRIFQVVMNRNLLRSTYFWTPIENANDSATIVGGRLILEAKKKGYNFSYTKVAVHDYERDFSLEARMTFISGDEDNFYGILWGATKGFYFFGVTANGNYAYRRMVNGNWIEIISYRPALSIKKGNASNILAIRKKTNKLEFLINGEIVDSAPAEKYDGFIGFHLNHYMKIEIDYIRMDYQ